MKLLSLAKLIDYSFQYVCQTSELYHIDDSHSLRHSIDVLHYANEIYQYELFNKKNLFYTDKLVDQQSIIYTSAILHDMCDKKYMDEKKGIEQLKLYMHDKMKEEELNIMSNIISTMSYSTVKKNGYPQLNEYNLAYHIVREADLLSAYDIERCIIYKMKKFNYNYMEALVEMKTVFETRILQYIPDNLFITEYSKKKANELHNKCITRLDEIDKMYFI
jgi:HD superfamily phosphodiesterase